MLDFFRSHREAKGAHVAKSESASGSGSGRCTMDTNKSFLWRAMTHLQLASNLGV